MAADLILFRDRDFLALNKPSGIPTTSTDHTRCLVDVARELDPHASMLHPSSRLDTQVTGVVIFARSSSAAQVLEEARTQGRYGRRYIGYTDVCPTPSQGSWKAPIEIPKKREAKPAHTDYRVLHHRGSLCLLEFRPRTGRTHQIRIHASKAGSPLLGDARYGGAKRLTLPNGAIHSIRRLMLHCLEVRIAQNEASLLYVRANVPGEFQEIWEWSGHASERHVDWPLI